MFLLPAPHPILRPDLCEAVANFVIKYPARLPRYSIQGGTYVRRTMKRAKVVCPQDDGRTVDSWPGGDLFRLDGKTPMGDTRPALYTSLDDHAVMAECLHYSKGRSQVPVIQYRQLEDGQHHWRLERTIFTLQVQRPLLVADLRRDDPNGMGFLKDMNADPAVKAALRKAGHAHLLLGLYHDHDFSTARGLAYAVDRHLGLAGVALNTARIAQHGDRFADNLALYGEYRQPLAALKVLAAQDWQVNPKNGSEPAWTWTYLDPGLRREDLGHFTGGPERR